MENVNHRLVQDSMGTDSNESNLDQDLSIVPREASSDRKAMLGVILVGVAFMLIMASFNTDVMQVVIDSIKQEDSSFHGSGYVSLAVIYAVFSVANWLTPSILSCFGPKWTMVFGGMTYVAFAIGFLFPHTWLLYVTSVFLGLGAAMLWTGQGNYLTLLSTSDTMGRNSCIFWVLQTCCFLRNVLVFYEFQGKHIIDHSTRTLVYVFLSVLGALGVLMLLLLPMPSGDGCRMDDSGTPSQELMKVIRLFRTRHMLLLAVTFIYTGLSLSFYSGVYSACIGFTLQFEDAKKLVGLSGIFIGCGSILGGATFGIFSKKTIKFGRDPIILLGYVVHIVCFFLIFINLPGQSPLGGTFDPSYLSNGRPNEFIAMLCSFLLGFGDSCFNTQIYSILGSLYAKNSGPAFAIFKFIQSMASSCSFFYASLFSLSAHLCLMTVLATAGTATFCVVEWNDFRRQRRKTECPLRE